MQWNITNITQSINFTLQIEETKLNNDIHLILILRYYSFD